MKLAKLLKRNQHTTPDCEDCAEGIEHQVFITAPPGWGSIMKCSKDSRRHGTKVRTPDDISRLRASRQ